MYYNFYAYQKPKETSLYKKISKKNSSRCRDESMNAVADKAHKQGMPQCYGVHTVHPWLSESLWSGGCAEVFG